LAIYYHFETKTFPLKKRRYSAWIKKCIDFYCKVAGNINIIFVSNKQIKELNRKFLRHNYGTDIITFNYNHENIISGDLFVSVEQIKNNIVIYNEGFYDELSRVIIHGILHLLGYNDSNDLEKLEIREKENFWLSKI